MYLVRAALVRVCEEVLLQEIDVETSRELVLTSAVMSVNAVAEWLAAVCLEVPDHLDHGILDDGMVVVGAFIILALDKEAFAPRCDINILDALDRKLGCHGRRRQDLHNCVVELVEVAFYRRVGGTVGHCCVLAGLVSSRACLGPGQASPLFKEGYGPAHQSQIWRSHVPPAFRRAACNS